MLPSSEKLYQNSGNFEVLSNVPKHASKVLDIGCGAGSNAEILQRRGCQVDAITISHAEAQEASRFCARVFIHDVEEGLPDLVMRSTYDCILCSHLIEHLKNPDTLLKHIKLILSTGGILVVALPNLLYYKNRFHLMLGRFEYQETGLMDHTHYKWYTYSSAQKLFERHGFSRFRSYATGSFPLPFLRQIFHPNKFQVIDEFACRLLPSLFGYQFIFVYKIKHN